MPFGRRCVVDFGMGRSFIVSRTTPRWLRFLVATLGTLCLTSPASAVASSTPSPLVVSSGPPPPGPNPVFGPLQVGPGGTSATTRRAHAAQAADYCQLYADTALVAEREIEFFATVSCNGEPPPGAEVEECPQKLINGSWITESTDCRYNTSEGPTWLEADKTQWCTYGVTFRTWSWDWLPGFTPQAVVVLSSTQLCT